MENIIIIGGGISGLTAAIYTARANLKPKIISGNEEGGQLMLTTDVENFPGFPEGIMGPELIERCKKQAERFGAVFISENATGFRKENEHFVVSADGKEYHSKSIIISTGASAKFLGIESEKK